MKPSPTINARDAAPGGSNPEPAGAGGHKNCPWCDGDDLSAEPTDKLRWAVSCNGCGAQGPTVLPGRAAERAQAEPVAFTAWNDRP